MKAHFNCQDDMNWKCTTSRLHTTLLQAHFYAVFGHDLSIYAVFIQIYFLVISFTHWKPWWRHKMFERFLEKFSFGMYYDETFMVISKHCESSQPDNAKGVNEYKWPPLCSLARACMVVTWCVLSSFFCNHNSYSLMMKLITFCL